MPSALLGTPRHHESSASSSLSLQQQAARDQLTSIKHPAVWQNVSLVRGRGSM